MLSAKLDPGAADAAEAIGPRPSELMQRLVVEKDATAMAVLIERFGGMVWGICRRVLPTDEDAEDAFQAVFLVLVKKAVTIRKKEAVGSWLHGVAFRTAMKARRDLRHRRRLDSKAKPPAATPSPPSVASCQELHRILDEEVERLPAKLKAPFVLCCLEGMSRAEAAGELDWSAALVASRLARARQQLQRRLVRRGVTLSATLTLLALSQQTAAAAAPALLVQATISSLAAAGTGQTAAALSPAAVTLAQGVLRSVAVAKLKVVTAVVLTLSVAVGGAAIATNQGEPLAPLPAPAQAAAVPPVVFVALEYPFLNPSMSKSWPSRSHPMAAAW